MREFFQKEEDIYKHKVKLKIKFDFKIFGIFQKILIKYKNKLILKIFKKVNFFKKLKFSNLEKIFECKFNVIIKLINVK